MTVAVVGRQLNVFVVPAAYAVPADIVQYADKSGHTVAEVTVVAAVGDVAVVLYSRICSSSIMVADLATERANLADKFQRRLHPLPWFVPGIIVHFVSPCNISCPLQ